MPNPKLVLFSILLRLHINVIFLLGKNRLQNMLRGDSGLMFAYFAAMLGVLWQTVRLASEWALRNLERI
jgi:hypothetical protein